MPAFLKETTTVTSPLSTDSYPTLADVEAAQKRLSPYLPVTPLTPAWSLSERLGRSIRIKWDNKLRTGSFKERGALNFLLMMDEAARKRGVCAASAGNHALGLSYHANRLGVPCHLVMPMNAPLVKVESCRRLGAEILLHGTLTDALVRAKALATEKNLTFVPPFDHLNVVTGQGVAGLEVLEQAPDADAIIIPIGGGGYAAGLATAVKAKRPDMFILGVCSEWALKARTDPSLHSKGPLPTTIADGIAVKTIGSVTGPIIDKLVDSVVAVSESAIARAIIALLEYEHAVVEGAGAAAFAALQEGLLPERFKNPVVMVCGSNIDTNLLSRLIEHDMAERGRLLRVSISLPDRPGSLHSLSGMIATKGANILQVHHDRFYAHSPGNVEITVVMEVRDRAHAEEIVQALTAEGMETRRV